MFRNGLQTWHIVTLIVVLVLLFGANRLPGLARSVGESLKIFKKEIKDLGDDGSTTGTATGTTAGTATPAPTSASASAPVAPPEAPVNPADPNGPNGPKA
jgi:sec-independent protein translocase protein TatA